MNVKWSFERVIRLIIYFIKINLVAFGGIRRSLFTSAFGYFGGPMACPVVSHNASVSIAGRNNLEINFSKLAFTVLFWVVPWKEFHYSGISSSNNSLV